MLLILSCLFLVTPVLADDVTVQTQIQSSISVVFNYNTVNFGTLSAGTNNNPAPNQMNGIYNVTVDTNENYTLSASGTNFSGGSYSFNINNLKMDTDSDKTNLALGNAVTLSGTPQIIDSNIDYSITPHYHAFWLSIPSGQYATSYTSTITITYANV